MKAKKKYHGKGSKAKDPSKDRRRSVVRVPDTRIVQELTSNGGQIMKAAVTLGVHNTRVSAVSQKYGCLAELKKRETAFAGVENSVVSLTAVLETMRRGDGEDAKAFAFAAGIMFDKYLVAMGKAHQIHQTNAVNDTTTTTKIVDVADILSRLSREEFEQMMILRDKANGVQPPEELSNLDAPENYDDTTYQPPPMPELNQ